MKSIWALRAPSLQKSLSLSPLFFFFFFSLSLSGAGWSHTSPSGTLDSLSLLPPAEQPDDVEELSFETPKKLSPLRLGLFSGMVAAAYTGSYYGFLSDRWWGEPLGDFHWNADFNYARNVDKLGHAYSGQLMSEFFYDGLRWSGLSSLQARGWAAGASALTQVIIDWRDGYSPSWGFDAYDVLGGTLGGFWPFFQELWSPLSALEFKASYWLHSRAYWRQPDEPPETLVFTDDYVNWTFWLSWKVHRALPAAAAKWWPEWLALAVGVSLDDKAVVGNPAGHREYYLALDYDLPSLFKPQSHLGQRVADWFNLIKLPAPAVRILPSGERRFFLFYPIQF